MSSSYYGSFSHASDPFLRVPDTLFRKIISYLTVSDVGRLSCLSKDFHLRSDDGEIWADRIEEYISPGMYCPFWPLQASRPGINPKRAYQSLLLADRNARERAHQTMEALLTMRNYQNLLDRFMTGILISFIAIDAAIAVCLMTLALIAYLNSAGSDEHHEFSHATFLLVQDMMLLICYTFAVVHLRQSGCMALIQPQEDLLLNPPSLVRDLYVFVLLMMVQTTFAIVSLHQKAPCTQNTLPLHHYIVLFDACFNIIAIGLGVLTWKSKQRQQNPV